MRRQIPCPRQLERPGSRKRSKTSESSQFIGFDLPGPEASKCELGGCNHEMKHAAIIGVSTIATLVCVPFEIAANAKGSVKMHSFHFGKHFRSAHHNKNFNQWPWWGYGGLYAMPPYDFSYNGDYTQPRTVVFVSQSPSALSCQSSKEIKTVPAEGGGTREITITRC